MRIGWMNDNGWNIDEWMIMDEIEMNEEGDYYVVIFEVVLLFFFEWKMLLMIVNVCLLKVYGCSEKF